MPGLSVRVARQPFSRPDAAGGRGWRRGSLDPALPIAAVSDWLAPELGDDSLGLACFWLWCPAVQNFVQAPGVDSGESVNAVEFGIRADDDTDPGLQCCSCVDRVPTADATFGYQREGASEHAGIEIV